MSDAPDFTEHYDNAKATAIARSQGKVTDLSFSPGYMFDVLTGEIAAVGDEATRHAIELHRNTFFETAAGEDLDRLARDHFGLERVAGAPAIGTVRFSRATTDGGNISIPVGTRVATADSLVFRTTAAAQVLTGLQLDVPIAAEASGEEGIVAAATITRLVDTLDDSTITVSNLERTAGGLGPESDTAFRKRISGYLATVRRGTVAAIEFGASQVAGVLEASLDESSFPPTLYISDATGGANAALIVAVQTELVNFRAAGIPVNVVGATVVLQPVALALTFAAGFDTAAARDAAVAAVVAQVNSIGIGETLYRSAIVAAAKITGVVNVVVSNPAGDVQPTASQLIRTSASLVTLA